MIHQFWLNENEIDELGLISLKSILNHHPGENKLWTLDSIELLFSREQLKLLNEICNLLSTEFSDILRYLILYQYGGWWLDTDIILFNKLEVPNGISDFYVRVTETKNTAFPNVIYSKPKQPILDFCYKFNLFCIKYVKWNKAINDYIKAKNLTNWELPYNWFGAECNVEYFRQENELNLPIKGIHICRTWAKANNLLDNGLGIYQSLKDYYL